MRERESQGKVCGDEVTGLYQLHHSHSLILSPSFLSHSLVQQPSLFNHLVQTCPTPCLKILLDNALTPLSHRERKARYFKPSVYSYSSPAMLTHSSTSHNTCSPLLASRPAAISAAGPFTTHPQMGEVDGIERTHVVSRRLLSAHSATLYRVLP